MTQSERQAQKSIKTRLDRYVDEFKENGVIRSPAIESAFRSVPRHQLVNRFFVANKEFTSRSGYQEIVNDPNNPDPKHLDLIYSHRALVTRLGANGLPSSSTSMPALVANMLELLRVQSGQKVLEIGAGTGYNAALIAEIVGDPSLVVSVDIQEDVVEQTKKLLQEAGYGEIKVLALDGFFGVPEESPFDRVVATVGLFDVSPHWANQLATGGEMLLPLYQGGACPLLRVRLEDERLRGKVVGGSGFMAIQGEMVPESPQPFPQLQEEEDSAVERRPGWDLGKGMGGARYDFWFFVTASEQRGSLLPVPGADDGTTWIDWTFGLAQGRARVVAAPDELVLVGKAEPLLERLNELFDLWETADRPSASDFEVEFFAKEDFTPTEGALAIERKYHWQVLKLPKV